MLLRNRDGEPLEYTDGHFDMDTWELDDRSKSAHIGAREVVLNSDREGLLVHFSVMSFLHRSRSLYNLTSNGLLRGDTEVLLRWCSGDSHFTNNKDPVPYPTYDTRSTVCFLD